MVLQRNYFHVTIISTHRKAIITIAHANICVGAYTKCPALKVRSGAKTITRTVHIKMQLYTLVFKNVFTAEWQTVDF